MRTIRRLAVAAAVSTVGALVATPALATVTAKQSPGERVQASVQATRTEGTAAFSGTITIRVKGKSHHIDFDGKSSLRPPAEGELHLDLSELGVKGGIDERIVGGAVYLDFKSLFDQSKRTIPDSLAGKRWVRADASDLGVTGGVGGGDPTSQLDALAGIDDVQKVGTDEVGGVSTTHYRGTIDVQKALANLPEPQRTQLQEALGKVKIDTTLPVDVWLDGRNRTRRLGLVEKLESSSTGTTTVTVDLELGHFGTDVHVAAPSEDETVSLQDLESAASANG